MKVCVYTICKNEINNIDNWLDCMKCADYMVILDTGSTDGTYEKLLRLANKFSNLKIYQKIINPFRFDVARNEAIKLCPKDTNIYVSMDMDETFKSKEWCNYLKSKWNDNYKIGNIIYIDNKENNEYNKHAVFSRTKIHTKDAFWKYPLHEVIVTDMNDITSGDSLKPKEKLETWDLDLRENNWDSLIVYHNSNKKCTPLYLELADLRIQEYPNIMSMFIKAYELFKNKKYEESYNTILEVLNEDYSNYKTYFQVLSNIYFYKGYIENNIFNDTIKALCSFKKSLENGVVNKTSIYELVKIYKSINDKDLINQLLSTIDFNNRFLRYTKPYNELENFLSEEFKRLSN